MIIPDEINNNNGKQERRYLIPKILNEIPNDIKTLSKYKDAKKLRKEYVKVQPGSLSTQRKN